MLVVYKIKTAGDGEVRDGDLPQAVFGNVLFGSPGGNEG